MRNSAAVDVFDGNGDELAGDDPKAELHELELEDLDEWEDETTGGDPAPEPETAPRAPAKKAPAAKKATAKKAAKR